MSLKNKDGNIHKQQSYMKLNEDIWKMKVKNSNSKKKKKKNQQ